MLALRRRFTVRRLVPILLVLASCSFSTKLTGPGGTSSSSSGTSGSTTSSNRQIPMPDLLGKTPEEAERILRSAGFEVRTFAPATQGYSCDYDRNKSYPLFAICYQRPVPGQLAPSQLRAEYVVERSQGNRGEIGTPNEYISMPEVRGMSLAQARKVLADAGLPLEKHFDVEVAGQHERCEYDVVCQTSPGPKMRKNLTVRGTIKVGMKAPPKPPAPTKPTEPTQPTQPSQPPADKPDTYF